MSIVIDSSIALAWIYDDERTEAIERILEIVIESSGWVPAIWRLEVANGLQQGIRRGRINASFRDRSLSDLAAMNIAIDAEVVVSAQDQADHVSQWIQNPNPPDCPG